MPDKESELTEYMLDEDAEFLKRRSVYHEALGCYVGALDESSIFKSLHCYLRPKGAPLTPHEACAQNIDGAIREWFNHGKEVFDKRRAQMTQIAKTCDIDFMCTMLNMTYENVPGVARKIYSTRGVWLLRQSNTHLHNWITGCIILCVYIIYV
jgi:hypothetical protein